MIEADTANRHDEVNGPGAGLKLGVVCPMANEAETAEKFVGSVLAECRRAGFSSVTFFAVLDNASKDGTVELLQRLQHDVPELQVVWAPENTTVVDAYLRGYREAIDNGCDWILEIDAGFSHQPSDIPPFFAKMSEGYDCVFGSRYTDGGKITETSLKRRLISRGGSIVSNVLLGAGLSDMTSGFELFSRPALQMVLNRGVRSRGHFFQTEIKTYCRKLKIASVPIHYRAASDSVNAPVMNDAVVNLLRLFRLRLTGRL